MSSSKHAMLMRYGWAIVEECEEKWQRENPRKDFWLDATPEERETLFINEEQRLDIEYSNEQT